jgi:spore coat protein A
LTLTRRTFVCAGGAALAAPGLLARGAAAAPFERRLPLPEVLRGADLHVPMVEAEVPILPGAPTRMWTYGGTFPGPLVRRPTGERTTVRFSHRLPAVAGELSVHLHGGHNRSRDDGQPGGLTPRQPRSLYCDVTPGLTARESGNDVLIHPGASRTYRYDFTEAGARQRSAIRFYHDHRLDHTGRNMWRGLAGMWISDDPLDRALPLPDGDRDIPLMITERSFDRHNQLTNPFTGTAHAPFDQVVGKVVLVNGAVTPHHPVEACRYRLRILNASNFSAYNVSVGNGAKLIQIGTESGLLPRPLERRRILLGPAERADVIIDFTRAAHSNVVLRSVPRPHAPNKLGSRPHVGPLMQFRVGGKPRRDRTHVPAELRPLPAWTDAATPEVDHEWKITVGGGFIPAWLINGNPFDPGRVDHQVRLGTQETWRLANKTGVAHLLHIHHTDWYMLSRNGRRPPAHERALKETFYLDPGDEVVVAGRFSDYTGKYVLHCHMLEHEDHGLMSQFEAV